MKELSIIIVNWNTRDYLKECLLSLKEGLSGIDAEIWVVDNNSADGSVEMLGREFSYVNVIENKNNVGFGRANNQAIKKSNAEYILLLNPDTRVKKEAVSLMLSSLKEKENIAIAGPKVLNEDGSIQYECARQYPTAWNQFMVETTLYKRFPKSRIFGSYLMSYWDHKEAREVDCISGSCMMIKRSVLDKVSLFDESFFMYAEDVDLCYRIKKAGYKIWYLADAEIIHYQGRSSHQAPFAMSLAARESMMKYFSKHHGYLSVFLYRFLLFLACSFMILVSAVLKFIHKRENRAKYGLILTKSIHAFFWSLRLKNNNEL